MSELLDRDSVIELLTELGRRLDERGTFVELYLVGGTAMLMGYDRNRMTRDIDAVWPETSDMQRPMLPLIDDTEAFEALVLPGVSVTIASPRHMIAMKARAARDARDLDDISLLCAREGITTVTEVLAIADDVWGPGMLREEAVFTLREGLTERGLRGESTGG